MSDQKIANESLIAELTPEELALLAKLLKRVEADLFHAVLKRFSYYLIAAVVILTVAGIINFYALADRIENSAVQRITSDPALQSRIIEKASETEKENARAASTFVDDLKEINSMLKQMTGDLSKRLPPTSSKKGNRNGASVTR